MSNYASANFGLLASLGLISGIATVNKFGEAIDCDDDVPTDVWDGAGHSISTPVWVPPTVARVHALVSASTSDAAAGVGARTIQVYGLPSWDAREVSEVVTLNGTTPVNTVNSYVIIHRMKNLTWGTTGYNVGAITATAAVDGTITAAIHGHSNANQTQMCIYGVPSTQKLRLTSLMASIVKGNGITQRADGELLVMVDPAVNVANNTAWINKENFSLIEAGYRWEHAYGSTPKKIDGPAILKIQVTSNAANVQTIGSFDAFLIDN